MKNIYCSAARSRMSPYRSIYSLKAILSNRELDLSLPTTTILRTPLAPRAFWVRWSLRSIAGNLSLYIDALSLRLSLAFPDGGEHSWSKIRAEHLSLCAE